MTEINQARNVKPKDQPDLQSGNQICNLINTNIFSELISLTFLRFGFYTSIAALSLPSKFLFFFLSIHPSLSYIINHFKPPSSKIQDNYQKAKIVSQNQRNIYIVSLFLHSNLNNILRDINIFL